MPVITSAGNTMAATTAMTIRRRARLAQSRTLSTFTAAGAFSYCPVSATGMTSPLCACIPLSTATRYLHSTQAAMRAVKTITLRK